ncbi:fructosamine kinase family protein [Hutsoniella sourekii]|uniref:fructosamine kinase family protein n=1 Tax=Hutsoniella sourekii TaxID=87650 RepID=UPI0004883EC4|nr:fructosamine kinase family protein [Hutsoniella sourekii]
MKENWLKQLPIDPVIHYQEVSGGDVNAAYRIETQAGESLFLLVQAGRDQAFFAGEVAGLKRMAQAGIQVPEVIAFGDLEGDAYLILTYLDEVGQGSQKQLGELVARLHLTHQPEGLYGFDYPYQGSDISFSNQWTDCWVELFVQRRLDGLAQSILNKGLWQESDIQVYRQARSIILDHLAHRHIDSSLLHGDLWAGNYMYLADGSVALCDPSSLYGDRELDLGVATVFGGFGPEFFQAYHEVYPLEAGYQVRLEFYRLYYLMIHLNKFGSTYAGSVDLSLQKILSNPASSN